MESVAYADVAVVDSRGRLTAWAGDPEHATFWRSSAKPFQALPLILEGGVQQFDLTGPELAIVTSSHGGEERHLELVTALLEKIGAGPADLGCGVHWPSTLSARKALLDSGREPTALHNNCSGKHTGMLMLARKLGAPAEGYLAPDHPVQLRIAESIRRFTGLSPHASIKTAIDGCGAPTFFLPLNRMAFAYAQLADPRGMEIVEASAMTLISEALRAYPELVSGEDRLEVRLSEASGGRFVAKGGAEAVFGLGIPERGWGMAIKVADGNSRTLATTVIHVLASLGLLGDEAMLALNDLVHPVIRNHEGIAVGSMRPVLNLHTAQISIA